MIFDELIKIKILLESSDLEAVTLGFELLKMLDYQKYPKTIRLLFFNVEWEHFDLTSQIDFICSLPTTGYDNQSDIEMYNQLEKYLST